MDLDPLWEIAFPPASGTRMPSTRDMTRMGSGDSAERPLNSRASEVRHNSETNRKSIAEASQTRHSGAPAVGLEATRLSATRSEDAHDAGSS